ncbi:hypothetical protein FB45DRAFT_918771 [Roridomyces roridus]|uniref:F-box domain-containing protein n=1 Tax=Roridomyces roridus TaxID=1738132 RepID=A0AAD7BRE7_9AGAR|nr:hypothetical protein FB45DRAFT_918771 [Roridomyces roridus]
MMAARIKRVGVLIRSRMLLSQLPNEIWEYIFALVPSQSGDVRKELLPLFSSCRHFSQLVLPIVLLKTGTTRAGLASGVLNIPSNVIPLFSVESPPVTRMTCTFNIDGDAGRVPQDLAALKLFLSRIPYLVDLRLNFLGDLLSSPEGNLVDLSPRKRLLDPFCDLLSSLPDPDAPVVFVGTEIFTCRAADIRSWRLDRYEFTALAQEIPERRAWFRKPKPHPLRNKVGIRLHNGRETLVFPFISISSMDIQHFQGPFGSEFAPWTLVVINPGMSHWPNVLKLSAPLSAEEWAAILQVVNFPKLPFVRMDGGSGIPAPVLDAFLRRHPTIARMDYFPDPNTLPIQTYSDVDAPFLTRLLNLNGTSRALRLFPSPAESYWHQDDGSFLPRMRNITTTARGVLHLFRRPGRAFRNLYALRITGEPDSPEVISRALSLLARHHDADTGLGNPLLLELSTGSWMASPSALASAALLRCVNTVMLCRCTDFVGCRAIVEWLGRFPGLRRVGLQDCLHEHVGEWERREFVGMVKERLPKSVDVVPGQAFLP